MAVLLLQPSHRGRPHRAAAGGVGMDAVILAVAFLAFAGLAACWLWLR